MIKPILNTQIIFLILIVINTLFVNLVKTHKRYFLGQTIFFALTLLSFLIWNIYIFPHYKDKIETDRNNDTLKSSGQISNEVWRATKKEEDFIYSINKPIFELCVFQTMLTFLFSLIGLKQTSEKKLFQRMSIIFGILSVLFAIIYFFASLVSGGMVT